MGWFSNIFGGIGDVLKTVASVAVPVGLAYATGGMSAIGSLAMTAGAGFLLSQTSKASAKKSDSPTARETTAAEAASVVNDAGVRLQVPPGQDEKIPVLYGKATFGGIITEAVQSNDNKTMTIVLTLSEKTGVKISDNLNSEYFLRRVYYNDQRVSFRADGVTAAYSTDREGNIDYSIQDLVKIWVYAGGSNAVYQIPPDGTTISTIAAWFNVPGWTSAMQMSDLVFAVVQFNYSREKNVTAIPDLKFTLENSMSMPGDCLNDYMTNTRYGAGIAAGDIYVE